ncbi:hypothetical protein JCM3775_003572 [Rhodotorula graminis]|uniref:Uncharacterized protein n=1 Tax=Rhodotorula graminis (strain WP1) TaxID=578459 RepID=A0A194S974_RHOGW|nr:uncharacterized protein RHOBADRAFT_51162 [Rhodotorula graminis WP1]KPV77283.1 hypothetical protein RHOBADRAFT_51162 [Rhodotorula graminis WP1]
MRSAGLLHGARPRRVPASRPLQRSPGFSTLAPPRPSLVRPRAALSPSLLLVHIGTISFATCFIPVIGARAATSRATAEAEQAAQDNRGTLSLAQPLQRPNPPNLQLFRLAAQLRRQIPASPQDAAFTLRQLHLVNQEPKLFLPDPPSPSSSSSPPTPLIFPETWVWRLPAAAALHAILRLLATPTPSPAADALLPVAIRITRHALQFDTVMWGAVLRSRDERAAERWDERVERDRATAEVEGGTPPTASMPRVALAKRPRERTASPSVEAWSRDGATLPSESLGAVAAGEPAATSLRPPASLPARSLDRLFLHIARDRTHASTALSISLALSRLRRRRTPEALSRSIDLALHAKQLDVAAQFCADWLAKLDDPTKSPTSLVRAVRRLSKQMRDAQRHFAAVPSLAALGAVAHLARALDDSWARLARDEPGPRGAAKADRSGAIGALVHLLVKVPDAPSPLLFKRGSTRRRHARAHVTAARMAREALRRVLEDVVGREIVLDSSSSAAAASTTLVTSLGAALSVDAARRALALGLFDLNALLAYALHRLESPEVALAVLERMHELGLKPSAATENVLFGAFDGGEERGVERALRRAQEHDERGSGSERTAPTLISHVARTASNDEIERLVFRFLPELDLTANAVSSSSPSASDATSRLLSAHRDGASRAPPSTGRSPYLYTTLLHALACAGRTGLAERVFRNARWAAELSRTDGRKGWVVPPHAFTSMLWLYAAEVKRGRALERRAEEGDERGGAYVRGWGRHALRVFLLRESRAHLAAQLGPSSSSSSFSSTPSSLSLSASSSGGARPRRHDPFRALPTRVLRSEAAPLVAIYELEGGSRADEERASLAEAMRAPHSREALRVLFPEQDEEAARRRAEEEGDGEGQDGRARRLSEMGQQSWRRGERATMRRRPQWGRPPPREARAQAGREDE